MTPYPGAWGDQGDGTFINPILPGDYSDIDAIRVGGDFYAISSTFQFSPGIVVLHSRDLVSWSILGHAVADLRQIGPALNWDSMDRYGRGIWAPAIRFHDDRYWIYFCTPDEGCFMTTAADSAGPWEPLYTGCSIGRDGMIAVHSGMTMVRATRLPPISPARIRSIFSGLKRMGERLFPVAARLSTQSPGSEASKLFKHDGL